MFKLRFCLNIFVLPVLMALPNACMVKDTCEVLEKHSDGKVKTKRCYEDRLAGKYRTMSFYENGLAHDTVFYNADTLVEAIIYDTNRTRCVVRFVDGKANGTRKCYYPNGSIFCKGDFYMDERIGEWIFYHPNGEIKSYEYFATDDTRIFLRHYSEDGVVEKSMGSGVAVIASKDDTVLSVGQDYYANVFLIDPPDCNVSLDFVLFDENLTTIKRHDAHIENNVAVLHFQPREAKNYIIGSAWKISFKDGTPIDSGMITQKFIVN